MLRRGRTYLILQPRDLGPSAHHERIISCEDGDHIYAFLLELIELLEVRREMLDVTCALWMAVVVRRSVIFSFWKGRRSWTYGEGSRDGEKYDLLSLPFRSAHLGCCIRQAKRQIKLAFQFQEAADGPRG